MTYSQLTVLLTKKIALSRHSNWLRDIWNTSLTVVFATFLRATSCEYLNLWTRNSVDVIDTCQVITSKFEDYSLTDTERTFPGMSL